MMVLAGIVLVLFVVGCLQHLWRNIKNGTYDTRPMHYKKHGERDRRI
jgi:hypothetical protein